MAFAFSKSARSRLHLEMPTTIVDAVAGLHPKQVYAVDVRGVRWPCIFLRVHIPTDVLRRWLQLNGGR